MSFPTPLCHSSLFILSFTLLLHLGPHFIGANEEGGIFFHSVPVDHKLFNFFDDGLFDAGGAGALDVFVGVVVGLDGDFSIGLVLHGFFLLDGLADTHLLDGVVLEVAVPAVLEDVELLKRGGRAIVLLY